MIQLPTSKYVEILHLKKSRFVIPFKKKKTHKKLKTCQYWGSIIIMEQMERWVRLLSVISKGVENTILSQIPKSTKGSPPRAPRTSSKTSVNFIAGWVESAGASWGGGGATAPGRETAL